MTLRQALRDVSTIRTLLSTAEAEARLGGDELSGVEHLVLAAAALPDGTAARALAVVGTDADRLRAAVRAVHADALGLAPDDAVEADPDTLEDTAADVPTGVFRCTTAAREVFQQASSAARAPRSGGLQGGQVVVAACDLQRGTFVRALDRMGVSRAQLRDAAAAALDGSGRRTPG